MTTSSAVTWNLEAFKKFNAAVNTLTVNSRSSSPAEREKVINFLARCSHDPDIIKIILDALRRFGDNFSEAEKIRIAEILNPQGHISPLTMQSLRDSVEKIIIRERSPQVGSALMRMLEKITE